MPHQCTECGHTFEDGSKEMLSGCPECGGNKFQFMPEGAASAKADPDPDPDPEPEPEPDPSPDSRPDSKSWVREDSAQADARSSVVDSNDLPEHEQPDDPEESEEFQEPEGADLDRLREELNDQFESIRIVDHGQYELNLMELYKREEFIIALQENGRYVIEVPESFRRGPEN